MTENIPFVYSISLKGKLISKVRTTTPAYSTALTDLFAQSMEVAKNNNAPYIDLTLRFDKPVDGWDKAA